MDLKLKFSPHDSAFFLKTVTDYQKIKIKSISAKVSGKGNEITYISDKDEEFKESDLMTKREFCDYITNADSQ